VNFLAHIHIAVSCDSDISGNLLGDFVKGDPAGRFPDDIVQGIRLHRFVDSYTDSHPCMREAKRFFPQHLRRFAPIALDMFWDHCLANRWHHFSAHSSLSDFVAGAERNVRNRYESAPELVYPENYMRVTERMWEYNWLESYARLDVLELALQRMSQRSQRVSRLEECFPVLQRYYHEFMEVFEVLYPDVLEASQAFYRKQTAAG
jgi:acyl carrier protein phosphodiesterase